MAAEQGGTLRAQWLGQQLREMREQAGLTLKGLAAQCGRDSSWASRMESAIYPARLPDVLAYLDICGIDDPRRRDDLKTMAQDTWQRGWWDGFTADVVGSLIDWIWIESRAKEIRSFEVSVLPGLLQTREYAETLIRADQPDASDERIARFIELRMTRQLRLTGSQPITLATVIDEGALRRMVGGPEIMRAQLTHLIEMDRHRHIEVRVLPAAIGAHSSPDGAFHHYRMPRPYLPVGLIATAAGNVVIEGEGAASLARTYDRLHDAALTPEASVDFLTDLISRLE